jgi:hypothetical protein
MRWQNDVISDKALDVLMSFIATESVLIPYLE